MRIIKTNRDVAGIKFGEQYIIDVFPDSEDEEQEVTQEMLSKRDELQLAVEKEVSRQVEEKKTPPGQEKK